MRWNKRRKKKAIHKLAIHSVGFTGHGPSLLETKQVKRTAKPTWREKQVFDWLVKDEKTFRQGCFRQACIDTLGEDPEDWGKPLEQMREEMDDYVKGLDDTAKRLEKPVS